MDRNLGQTIPPFCVLRGRPHRAADVAVNQQRRFWPYPARSAFPPIATGWQAAPKVSDVALADMGGPRLLQCKPIIGARVKPLAGRQRFSPNGAEGVSQRTAMAADAGHALDHQPKAKIFVFSSRKDMAFADRLEDAHDGGSRRFESKQTNVTPAAVDRPTFHTATLPAAARRRRQHLQRPRTRTSRTTRRSATPQERC